MTTTVRVTCSAEGSPNTVMTFDLSGIDIEGIKKQLSMKKKELLQNLMYIRGSCPKF
jgi:hypothetical protein